MWEARKQAVPLLGIVVGAFAVVVALLAPAIGTARRDRQQTRHTARAGRSCAHANTRASAASKRVIRRAVLCLVNQERTSRGLPPLHGNAALTRSAQKWTNVLVRSHQFTHGSNFAGRISAEGYRWRHVGENIASGFRTPRAVVKAWMRSQGHCHNILDPHFADVGTGVVNRPTGVANVGSTWTQDFGLRRGHSAPSNNTGPQSGCPY